jgi:hypothetical protein
MTQVSAATMMIKQKRIVKAVGNLTPLIEADP